MDKVKKIEVIIEILKKDLKLVEVQKDYKKQYELKYRTDPEKEKKFKQEWETLRDQAEVLNEYIDQLALNLMVAKKAEVK